MQVYQGYAKVPAGALTATAVGIGIFDGMHLGHQTLLRRVIDLAQARRLTPVAYTFAPHPRQFFCPQSPVKLIEPLETRLERFAQLGIACSIVEPFDAAFAALAPRDYIERSLCGALGTKEVVVGQDFVFGQGKGGNAALLGTCGRALGFASHALPHVHVGTTVVSNTQVRAHVQAGRMREAALLLGRAFMLQGTVVHGSHRGGSQLGYPTANLDTDNALLPPPGIYAAVAHGVFGTLPAVISVGHNPTFGDITQLRIEAHLPGYTGPDFYGTGLRLSFTDWLRGEERFDSLEALKAQIAADIRLALG